MARRPRSEAATAGGEWGVHGGMSSVRPAEHAAAVWEGMARAGFQVLPQALLDFNHEADPGRADCISCEVGAESSAERICRMSGWLGREAWPSVGAGSGVAGYAGGVWGFAVSMWDGGPLAPDASALDKYSMNLRLKLVAGLAMRQHPGSAGVWLGRRVAHRHSVLHKTRSLPSSKLLS
jgi:hypothetical protein